jgi:hypothetical protein
MELYVPAHFALYAFEYMHACLEVCIQIHARIPGGVHSNTAHMQLASLILIQHVFLRVVAVILKHGHEEYWDQEKCTGR